METNTIIVENFLPYALVKSMRDGINSHFGEPHLHQPGTHQVWNYWHVPGLYTYLRTNPERIIDRQLVSEFMGKLMEWATTRLGTDQCSWPYLSLYVPGCRQNWHNDAGNGKFAFVYSLTHNNRETTGGQTLIMRDLDTLRENMTHPAAGTSFFEMVEPKFNRLIVFDDRLPHAVERLEGPMDPLEGRFVLHGHLS